MRHTAGVYPLWWQLGLLYFSFFFLSLCATDRAEQNEESAGVPETEKTGCWEGQVQRPEEEAVTRTQLSSGTELQILNSDDREDADDKRAGSEGMSWRVDKEQVTDPNRRRMMMT